MGGVRRAVADKRKPLVRLQAAAISSGDSSSRAHRQDLYNQYFHARVTSSRRPGCTGRKEQPAVKYPEEVMRLCTR